MAKRLTIVLLRFAVALLPLMTLSACVSTEELYAEYDAVNCEFVVQESSTGKYSLRELISNTHFPWEPAVYFDFDSHEMDAPNRKLLESTIEVMTRYPQLNLSLQGFADRIGTRFYNLNLANRRVNEVREYLIANGIESKRVVDQPLGKGLTQFSDNDELSRSINRRVELMLLDEDGRPLHPLFDFSGL